MVFAGGAEDTKDATKDAAREVKKEGEKLGDKTQVCDNHIWLNKNPLPSTALSKSQCLYISLSIRKWFSPSLHVLL